MEEPFPLEGAAGGVRPPPSLKRQRTAPPYFVPSEADDPQ